MSKKETKVSVIKEQSQDELAHPSIPIICSCLGNPPHLSRVLQQAKNSNPRSIIYLIGDQRPEDYPMVKCISIQDYSDAVREATLLSRGDREVLNNLVYWITLDRFVSSNKIKRFFTLEPSVLLFSDITTLYDSINNISLTISEGRSAKQSYWRTEMLHQFIEFLRELRKGPSSTDWRALIEAIKLSPLSPFLRTFHELSLALFSLQHRSVILENTTIIDDSVFDACLTSQQEGFALEDGVKKIVWKDGVPYGRLSADGKEVRMHSIAFDAASLYQLPDYHRKIGTVT